VVHKRECGRISSRWQRGSFSNVRLAEGSFQGNALAFLPGCMLCPFPWHLYCHARGVNHKRIAQLALTPSVEYRRRNVADFINGQFHSLNRKLASEWIILFVTERNIRLEITSTWAIRTEVCWLQERQDEGACTDCCGRTTTRQLSHCRAVVAKALSNHPRCSFLP
jgi:hypothetical protein